MRFKNNKMWYVVNLIQSNSYEDYVEISKDGNKWSRVLKDNKFRFNNYIYNIKDLY